MIHVGATRSGWFDGRGIGPVMTATISHTQTGRPLTVDAGGNLNADGRGRGDINVLVFQLDTHQGRDYVTHLRGMRRRLVRARSTRTPIEMQLFVDLSQ